MKLSDSDVKHLHRLLGFIRCEVGQSPDDLVATVRSILPALGEPDEAGKARLVKSYRDSAKIPAYVRQAIQALEKAIAVSGTATAAAPVARGRPKRATPRVPGAPKRLAKPAARVNFTSSR